MPEENTIVLPSISITRNGVTITTKTNKARSGLYYPQLDLSDLSFEDRIKLFGEEIVTQKLQQFINLTAQATLQTVTNSNVIPFESVTDKYKKAMEELSVRGETLGDLEDRIDDLTNQMVKLGESGDMSPETFTKIRKITSEIKAVNQAIAEKKERYKRNKEEGQAEAVEAAA